MPSRHKPLSGALQKPERRLLKRLYSLKSSSWYQTDQQKKKQKKLTGPIQGPARPCKCPLRTPQRLQGPYKGPSVQLLVAL